MKLSLSERETIILFNETREPATIFTYNRKWQQHLEKKLGLKLVMNNGFGGKEYKIDKKRIPMPRAPRKLSAEQKKAVVARLSKARLSRGNASAVLNQKNKTSGR